MCKWYQLGIGKVGVRMWWVVNSIGVTGEHFSIIYAPGLHISRRKSITNAHVVHVDFTP